MSAGQKKAPTARGGEGHTQGYARQDEVYSANEPGSRPQGVDAREFNDLAKGFEDLVRRGQNQGLTDAEIDRVFESAKARRTFNQHNLRSAISAEKKPEKPPLTDEQRAQRTAEWEKLPDEEKEAKILRSCLSEIIALRSPDENEPVTHDEVTALVALRLDMATGDDIERRMRRTAACCGLWTTGNERKYAILKVKSEPPRRYNGAELGHLLRLTHAEWLRLPVQFRTITPFDISKAERDRMKRDRHNERRRENRAKEQGRKARKGPTIEQVAKANGVSRRTVLRRKANGCWVPNSDGIPKIEKQKRGPKPKGYRR